jgi:hypothetical protein
MHSRKLLSIFALAFAAWVAIPDTVKAGGPPTPTASGAASVKGVVKFEGTVPKPKAQHVCRSNLCAATFRLYFRAASCGGCQG